MLVVCVAKSALCIALAILFWVRKMHRRFPAMGAYLVLHALSSPFFFSLHYCRLQDTLSAFNFDLAFAAFWMLYAADAVLLFFICMEVFRFALAPFEGLEKIGSLVFRWIALVSAIIGLSTIPFNLPTILTIFSSHPQVERISPSIAFGLTRSVSILELCLLTFLCLSMNALRLSVRDAAFGISLGLGVLSASDFIETLMGTIFPATFDALHIVSVVVHLFVLGIWVVYFALPEQARKPVLIPANSTVYRWNEIATALGYTGTKVAVQQPSNGFFLTDVERVVEMVIARNIKSPESES